MQEKIQAARIQIYKVKFTSNLPTNLEEKEN